MIRLVRRFWNWGIAKFMPYSIPGVIICGLAKAGALTQDNAYIFAMIGVICVVVLLIVFNRLKEPYYLNIIGGIGFALLIQTTLMGPGLIGSDIHLEYYFYNEALEHGWDFTIPHPYNAAIGATVIAPFLTSVFHISGYWIFKLVFPIMFAFVPVILYLIYKKEFGAKIAFLSCFFFVIVPTWSLEMISLPRQMLGELMLVLCLFLVIVSKWRYRYKVPLIAVLGILGAMFHYVMGPIILLYLGVGLLLLIFFKRRTFAVKWLALSVGVILVTGVAYYGSVAGGMPLECVTGVTKGFAQATLSGQPAVRTKVTATDDGGVLIEVIGLGDEGNVIKVIDPGSESDKDAPDEVIGDEVINDESNVPNFLDIEQISPLMRAAWGLDFMQANTWGKVFRVFQYLTQISIVIGVGILIWKRKDYSAEYLSLCGASIALLLGCMFIPRFASIINATRMYHIVLIMLSPALILGAKLIFRNFKLLTICLIIPYFLFTSGLVFEATQQTDISQVNMPYSISLSDYRIETVGVFTSNDIAVVDWADENIEEWVYADTTNILLFAERKTLDPYYYLVRALRSGEFVGGKYIFLSEKNNRGGFVTFRPGEWEEGFCRLPTSGLRVSMSYEEVGLDKVIAEGEIVYQQGDAFILEVKNDTSESD